MKLTFSHNGVSFETDYPGTGAGHAKLYRVPVEYSDDGYYIGVWQDTEIEPEPGCAVGAARLLCHARLENSGTDGGGLLLKNLETYDGANCHA